MGIREDKAGLREAILAERDRIDPQRRIEMSLAAAEHGNRHLDFAPGTVISGFLPIRSEIDARPLLDMLRERGARLCLPVVLDRTRIVFRELLRGGELVDTGFGTSGPGPNAAVLDPDILIMPLAVFDGRGGRIGYGAGHYDRAITRLHENGLQPRLVGLAFSCQETGRVPMESHDVPMEAIITENGYRRFGGEKG